MRNSRKEEFRKMGVGKGGMEAKRQAENKTEHNQS